LAQSNDWQRDGKMAASHAFCPSSLRKGLRGVPTRIDVTPNGGGEYDERAVLEKVIEYEMICFYFCGMADEDELMAHLEKLKPQKA